MKDEMSEDSCFIYTSVIPCSSGSFGGQNSFEGAIINALRERSDLDSKFELKIFSTYEDELPADLASDRRLVLFPLRWKDPLGYLGIQLRLFFAMGWFLFMNRGKRVKVFLRYHDSMAAPLLLRCLFPMKLVVRTGPVLPNLVQHQKRPSFLVIQVIKKLLGGFYSGAHRIITVSSAIKKWVTDSYPVPAQKVVIVPNAVDARRFEKISPARDRWRIPDAQTVVGFVGTVYQDQGLDTIVSALAILKQQEREAPHVFVVGGGSELETLQRQAKDLGVEDLITWTGQVAATDVPSAIHSCDAMLAPFPKRVFEITGSSAMKLYEYLACDKPILASRGDDHLFIERNSLGELVEPENDEAWADALNRVALNVPRLKTGQGQDYVRRNHSYPAVVDKLLEIMDMENIEE